MKKVTLAELRFTQEEIKSLGDELVSVLATLAYATNEINVISSLFIFSKPESSKDPIIKKKLEIQKYTLTRCLNAKIFEAYSSIEHAEKIFLRSKNKARYEALAAEFSKVNKNKSTKGYSIAKAIRDTVTNHYLPSVTHKNFGYACSSADNTMYIHDTNGDSFYPIAEHLVFAPALEKLARQNETDINSILRIWLEWSGAASTELTEVFTSVSERIIFDELFQKTALEKEIYVDDGLIGNPKSSFLPLFHQF